MVSSELESYLPPRRHAFSVGVNNGQVFVREAMLEADYLQTPKPKPHRDQQSHHRGQNQPQQSARHPTNSEDLMMQKEKELQVVRQAVGAGESLNSDEQARLLRQFSELKKQLTNRGGRQSHPHAYEHTAGDPAANPQPPQPSHGNPAGQPGQHKAYYAVSHDHSLSTGLEVGSPVQLAQDSNRTGVIRWIGTFPEARGTVAGVELVSHVHMYVHVSFSIIIASLVPRLSPLAII